MHRMQRKLVGEQFHEACKRHELDKNSDVHRIHIYEKCAQTSSIT